MTAAPDLRDALIACLAEQFFREPGQCGGHADALINGPLKEAIAAAAVEAERNGLNKRVEKAERRATRANARADVADKSRGYQRARAEGAEEARDSARRHCSWLNDQLTAAEATIRQKDAEIERLTVAFHDAIRRPLGVTPDSGTEFYDPRMADEAEARRPPGGRP